MSYSDFNSVQGVGSGGRSFFEDDLSAAEKGFARGPERHLMSALLYDAVQAYVNFACCDKSSPKSRYREAFEWVNRRGGDYIFSFENVCEALGIDANCLRNGLKSACDAGGEEMKRTRKNF